MNNVNILLNMNVEIFLITDAVLGIIFCGGLLLWGWGGPLSPLEKPNHTTPPLKPIKNNYSIQNQQNNKKYGTDRQNQESRHPLLQQDGPGDAVFSRCKTSYGTVPPQSVDQEVYGTGRCPRLASFKPL
jgi:hypothetical protein